MHQHIGREFGNIGKLDGRGGRAIMVIFISMRCDTKSVAKIEVTDGDPSGPLPFSLAKAV